jgi:hypothetical protein
LQLEVHHGQDGANSIMQIMDKIEKSQKELGDKIDKLIEHFKRRWLGFNKEGKQLLQMW